MSSSATISLAERTDIHKSCKSIESLLSILNEYCEAAGAVVSLQKRLGKALRDMAGIKVTGEIAANAMNASANIFEALSEVDSKYAKIADKEYDMVSIEVKKWFKKLAKEEKAHDERIASANAKIKQAGQLYEKKTKKKAADAAEEHARYINLISTLGPEVSQEKYNHAVNVNQKHSMTVYSVAASLSRLADTEWQKSCECVRRFSPVIGLLGQWKTLCEGGWTGPFPADLPDPDNTLSEKTNPQSDSGELSNLKAIEEEGAPLRPPTLPTAPDIDSRQSSEQLRAPPPGYATGPPSASGSSSDLTRDPNSTRNSPVVPRQVTSTTTTISAGQVDQPSSDVLEPPRAPFVDAFTGSVRSLSAFPTPPTHFPLPPPRQNPSQQSLNLSASSNLEFPSHGQLSESPASAHGDPPGGSDNEESRTERARRRTNSHEPLQQAQGSLDTPASSREYYHTNDWRRASEEHMPQEKYYRQAEESDIGRPMPIRSRTSLPAEPTHQANRDRETRHAPSSSMELKNVNNIRTQDDRDTQAGEFGGMDSSPEITSKSRAQDNTNFNRYPRNIERTDTGTSSGSIVAAMRDRYSNNVGSASPPLRDLPRLPLSVNDLASRYQPVDTPLSPGPRTSSPPVSRQQSLPLLDTAMRQVKEPYQEYPASRSAQEENHQRRQQQQQQQPQPPQGQRNDVVANLERKAKEHELKERELELERRALELEREKAKLQTLREEDRDLEREQNVYRESNNAHSQANQFGLRPRERRTSLRHQLQRPLSQMDLDDESRNIPLGNSAVNPKRLSQGHQSSTNNGYSGQSSSTQPLYSPRQPQNSNAQLDAQGYPNDSNRNGSDSNSNTNSSSNSSHAPYCGCESCSVSKYKDSGKVSNKAYQAKQPDQRSDKAGKPGGSWIRRLSMPVGNAFSSNDSKRHQSNSSIGGNAVQYSLGSGVGHIPSSPGRGLFSMDYKRNASTTALMSSGTGSGERTLHVQEDGRLRNGVSNRSMTNLGILGRH